MKHRILPGLLSTALTLSLCALPASALETEDTRMLLETYYVDEIPQEILNLDSTEAILEALNDPYTVYMSAEEYQAFLNQVDGETVVGIGVSIQNAVDDGAESRFSPSWTTPPPRRPGCPPGTASWRWTASPSLPAWTPPP